MIADVILGKNIDTKMWIKELKDNMADNIIVLDYDYFGDRIILNKVTYISSYEIPGFLKKFDSINYYKSLYVYPGMLG